jgi:hypothetical protein
MNLDFRTKDALCYDALVSAATALGLAPTGGTR